MKYPQARGFELITGFIFFLAAFLYYYYHYYYYYTAENKRNEREARSYYG